MIALRGYGPSEIFSPSPLRKRTVQMGHRKSAGSELNGWVSVVLNR